MTRGLSCASVKVTILKFQEGYIFIGALAQLGERYNGIVEVRGSIPLGSTKSPKSIRHGSYFLKNMRTEALVYSAKTKYQ